MRYLTVLVIVCLCLFSALGFRSPFRKGRYYKPDGPCGDPLFLTRYIESGEIQKGREAALVPPLKGHVTSYSGFFTVNKSYNSNIFFWFFPAENNSTDAPLAVWLQGGPGATSMYGLFTENGPYILTTRQKLKIRDYYWSQKLNMIYIDNPVGVGFSFTDDDAGYATNETAVGENLYDALVQFFQIFPEYRSNEFFVTGESYAGKYVPAVAYTIHKNNPRADVKINLKGIAIGDGLCDPENMMKYSDYLYELSLIDAATKKQFQTMEDEIVSLIKKKKFVQANDVMNNMISDGGLFYNVTGISNYYNYLKTTEDESGDIFKFMATAHIRASLHVGNTTFSGGDKAADKLNGDIMNSIKPWLEILMNHYRVLLYSGQLDIIVAYPLTMNMVQKLDWNGRKEYMTAARKQWYVDNELAGYAKTGGKFTDVLVRNAGHTVPGDQPVWALDLITRFTNNIAF